MFGLNLFLRLSPRPSRQCAVRRPPSFLLLLFARGARGVRQASRCQSKTAQFHCRRLEKSRQILQKCTTKTAKVAANKSQKKAEKELTWWWLAC